MNGEDAERGVGRASLSMLRTAARLVETPTLQKMAP